MDSEKRVAGIRAEVRPVVVKRPAGAGVGYLGLGWVNFGLGSSESMLSSQTCDMPLGLQWA